MEKEAIIELIKSEICKYHQNTISKRFIELEEMIDLKCSEYDVEKQMSDYESNIDDVVARVNYLEQLYLEETIMEMKSEINNLESEISDVRSSSNDYDIECRLDELESQSVNLDSRIDELESKISCLESQIE